MILRKTNSNECMIEWKKEWINETVFTDKMIIRTKYEHQLKRDDQLNKKTIIGMKYPNSQN